MQVDKKEHATKWIAIKNLSVKWAQSQRGLDEKFARQIADNLDPDYLGVITVTLPDKSGAHHVIDGWHRVTGVKLAFKDETQQVPCNVLNVSDPKKAADIFVQMNDKRRNMQRIDLFKASVTAGYKAETEINNLLKEMGYTVGFEYAEGTVRAVGACINVYERHGLAGLRDALLVIQAMWGLDAASTDGTIIKGVANFLNKYGFADRERLVQRVSKRYTPGRLIGSARAYRDVHRTSVPESIVRVLVMEYDHGLKKGRLSAADEFIAPNKANGKGTVNPPKMSAYDPHSGIGLQ